MIKTQEEAILTLSEEQQRDIVNWYADTFNTIEDVPVNEINYWLEEIQ